MAVGIGGEQQAQASLNHDVGGLDPEVNGFLSNDGQSAREVVMADIVLMVVQGKHISKVEVALLAHCHPLTLFDVQDLAFHPIDPE